ncbi:ABC transporter ATP-binding protein [Mariprofundus erugo]|uniref:Spermidine/putrescine import ATP-binding protein PotA n=1 Tax=Mariprofundus erugo TaxID=2528639 RepID=A0A5R9GFY1_9PROT|nr:ABC transporter ATP-binding protein [Mariprofundus erugo]TLS65390.1 ABC transporter ATP-binding protein [Mariprofundus erugo]
MLEIRGISKKFGDFEALKGVDLHIGAGEFFTLLGPSGCGKTTLLRMIAGFEAPDSGEILLEGKDMVGTPPEQRPVHTVFQNYALFPHMTVAQNIAFPLQMARVQADEIDARVQQALDNVHLPDKAGAYPAALSGGQRQRIAIARALVKRPRLLLLDEPLSALDAKMREQMQIELINLQKEVGITFIYVTHDQGEALALSHRIAVMNQGKIAQLDQPAQLYNHPNSRFVADFIGQCNLLEATVTDSDRHHADLELHHIGPVRVSLAPAVTVTKGQRCLLTLRPEKIRIARNLHALVDETHFCGKIHDTLYLGDVTVYKVELAQGILLEALLANSGNHASERFAVGDSVEVAWNSSAGHLIAEP